MIGLAIDGLALVGLAVIAGALLTALLVALAWAESRKWPPY